MTYRTKCSIAYLHLLLACMIFTGLASVVRRFIDFTPVQLSNIQIFGIVHSGHASVVCLVVHFSSAFFPGTNLLFSGVCHGFDFQCFRDPRIP